jgi:hypothetical protein
LIAIILGTRKLVQVLLEVLLDPGHYEATGANGLDPEAISRLNFARGRDRERDGNLMVFGHPGSPDDVPVLSRRRFVTGR